MRSTRRLCLRPELARRNDGHVLDLAQPEQRLVAGHKNLRCGGKRERHDPFIIGIIDAERNGIRGCRRQRETAQKINITVVRVEAQTSKEIGSVFAAMTRENTGAVIVANDPFFNGQSQQIAELAAKRQLPTVAAILEYVEAGGLMSYGPNNVALFRRAATYVDKIFKGAKPADLPVEQPTKFEMFINGKTAKALGLKIPQSLLIMTDKVIE